MKKFFFNLYVKYMTHKHGPYWFCLFNGHDIITEKYAVLRRNNRYIIVERDYCSRCGEVFREKVGPGIFSRAELLKNGWFIND